MLYRLHVYTNLINIYEIANIKKSCMYIYIYFTNHSHDVFFAITYSHYLLRIYTLVVIQYTSDAL